MGDNSRASAPTPSSPQGDAQDAAALSVRLSSGPRSSSRNEPGVSTENTTTSDLQRRADVPVTYPPHISLPTRSTYRLSDFEIHRTLGNGSFARVHLGRSLPISMSSKLTQLILSTEQIQSALLCDQSPQKVEDCGRKTSRPCKR